MKTTMGRLGLGLLTLVTIAGTIGFLGFDLLDAAYQTVTTVTTVGFDEVRPFGTMEKVFAIILIITGVGTVLYALTLSVHSTLKAAGIEQAIALVAALEGDAENLFVTLSGREIKPDLFIVARARQDESVRKLETAGADRVVNPQELGAARMASFVARPNVAEFVDVVMHERSLEFRMQELDVPEHSPIAGKTLRAADLRQKAGILVLAIRRPDGSFDTNPDPDTIIVPGHVIIAVGTITDPQRLMQLAR